MAKDTFSQETFRARTFGQAPAAPSGQAGFPSLLAFWLGGAGGKPAAVPSDVRLFPPPRRVALFPEPKRVALCPPPGRVAVLP